MSGTAVVQISNPARIAKWELFSLPSTHPPTAGLSHLSQAACCGHAATGWRATFKIRRCCGCINSLSEAQFICTTGPIHRSGLHSTIRGASSLVWDRAPAHPPPSPRPSVAQTNTILPGYPKCGQFNSRCFVFDSELPIILRLVA